MSDDERTLQTYDAAPVERGQEGGVRVSWPALDGETQTTIFYQAFALAVTGAAR